MMDEAFARLLVVLLICCTVVAFFVTSCVSKEKANLTNEEKVLIQLQDAYSSCQNKTRDEAHCLTYIKTLKESLPSVPKVQEVPSNTPKPH